MSLAVEVATALRAAITTTTTAREAITAIQAHADEITLEIQAASDGTNDNRPAEAVLRLQHARALLDEAVQLLHQGEAALETYIHTALGASDSSTNGNNHVQAMEARPSTPPIRNFRPAKLDFDKVKRIQRVGWPRTADGRISARGHLYRSNGSTWGEEPLKAGGKVHGQDLKEPWASDPTYTTTWHIEGHVAAKMRREETSDAVLYLNVPPCGMDYPDEPDPKRCHFNVAKILPTGYTLTIWSVLPSGAKRRKIVTGTGEAVK